MIDVPSGTDDRLGLGGSRHQRSAVGFAVLGVTLLQVTGSGLVDDLGVGRVADHRLDALLGCRLALVGFADGDDLTVASLEPESVLPGLVLEKLEAMTCVCSVGLDMVPVPGDTDAETLAAIMADELMIGVINSKTTAARLIPVPGKAAGEFVSFGGLFGESVIMKVRNAGKSARFVRFGGRIPAPIHSLKN